MKCLTERICGSRDTHYGQTFRVESKGNPSNLAYSPLSLNLHTDQPYTDTFDVAQLLHCMQQSGLGGENEFSDAFNAERIMKEESPEDWKILAETIVEFADNGHDAHGGFSKLNHRPTFQ